MTTSEIGKAIKNLEVASLKNALKALDVDGAGEKEELQSRYQNTVLAVGLKSFLGKLKEKTAEASIQALGKSATGKSSDEIKASLAEILADTGIHGLVDKAGDDLLKQYCETLGLEASDRDDMIKQIADEVMLTGMESFLNKLSLPILKSHCTEMQLPTTGPKKALVERLMVFIFELEPLEQENEKDKPKKEKKKKEKSSDSGKEKSKSKAKKEESKTSTEESEESKKEGSKTEKKAEPKKREKFVAPPLETIRKGKFDTYTDLYDNFNLPDLHSYCKQENLKASGKKKDVIKRILHYLETGEVEKPTDTKKRGKKKQGGPSVKKQKTKANGNVEGKSSS